MKLYLIGHNYKYAAEQMLMTLFPGEKPEYPDGKPEGKYMVIRLSRAGQYTTAVCLYREGEQIFRGRAAVRNGKMTDTVRTDSLCQQIIKLAVYRAVLRAGHERPAWGALTGVRPGKLMYPMLRAGLHEQDVVHRFEQDYDVSHERAQLCLDASKATMRADRLLQTKDVCLYIGIPFCPTRCAYCSFVSQSTEKSLSMCHALRRLHIQTDIPAVVKGSLCHDLGILGRNEKYSSAGECARRHPADSLEVAEKLIGALPEKTRDIISHHMWPVGHCKPPDSLEAAIVSAADKLAAVEDFIEGYEEKRPGIQGVVHEIVNRRKESTEWKTKNG